MTYTLLKLTQDILSALDSEEVNTLSDTTESLQVARIIEECYNEIVAELDIVETEGLYQLNASLDATKPCIMYIPEGIKKIFWIKYDGRLLGETIPNYQLVERIDLAKMHDLSQSFRESEDAASMLVDGGLGNDFTFFYKTTAAPTKYAALDNHTLVFDSFDDTVDTTLQKTKTVVYGSYYPTFTVSDTYVPDLNQSQMMLLLNLAKERAFVELKQVENTNARRAGRRQRIATQWQANKNEEKPGIERAPRYGRR